MRHPRSFLAAVALAAACCGAAWAADTPDTAAPAAPSVAERLAAARKAISARDWRAAQRELEAAVRQDNRNADVHNLLGYTLRSRASPDIPKAIEHYQTALRLDPRHKGAHEYIGQAWLTQKKPEEAEKHLAELEKICGNKTCEEYQDLAKALDAYRKQAR